MKAPTQTIASKWRKPFSFGLWAASGAAALALVGELWLAATFKEVPPPPPPAPPRQAVVMVLDTSGSMEGRPFEELKQAANEYVDRQNLQQTRIGIVSFSDSQHIEAPLTNDSVRLHSAINNLQVGGVTRMDLGLSEALNVAPPVAIRPGEEPEERSVLLFTDGVPGNGDMFTDIATPTVNAAQQILRSKARIVAIGTFDSDAQFLAEVTRDPKLVFTAGSGQYGEAFRKAQVVINTPENGTLLQAEPQTNVDWGRELWRAAVWAGLLGAGISGALLFSQARYSKNSFGKREAVGVAAGFIGGLVAGAAGQYIYSFTAAEPILEFIGRTVGWTIAGGIIGLGAAPFIPNLKIWRAMLAGLLGGGIGVFGFVSASYSVGEVLGRLLGAAIIGFAIGLMVVLAEVVFRGAWLRVAYGPADSFDMSLGSQAITVGNDPAQSHILAREVGPLESTYLMVNDKVFLEDRSGVRHAILPGDTRQFGNVEVTLCTPQNSSATRSVLSPPPVTPVAVPSNNFAAPTPPMGASSPALSGNVPSVSPTSNSTLNPTAAPTHRHTLPLPSSPPVVPAAPRVEGWYLQGRTRIALPATGSLIMGSGAQAEIELNEANISSEHVKLTVGTKMLTVRDLGTGAGTYVNGKRIEPNTPALLKNGDRLTVGNLNFILGRTE